MEPINLLVTLDRNYLPPLRALLKSAFISNPAEVFDVYMLFDSIPNDEIEALDAFCRYHGSRLHAISAEDIRLLDDAPVFSYYSKAMYYRLLAFELLSDTLDRVLYLDPDILVINPIRPLYETELCGHPYAACMLSGFADSIKKSFNRRRLDNTAEGYYNSGVLLLNLELLRKEACSDDIFSYIEAHKKELLLPDQDVLNALYGERILPLDDTLYNYGPHRYETYRVLSGGEKDLGWIIDNTVIVHFYGKSKPWMKGYRGRFGVLYRHYASLAERTMNDTQAEKNHPGDRLAASNVC